MLGKRDEDKPKAKDRSSFLTFHPRDLQIMGDPSPEKLDEAFKGVQKVCERTANVETFREAGKFLTLDAKILAVLPRRAR